MELPCNSSRIINIGKLFRAYSLGSVSLILSEGKYLFHHKALAKVFRAKMLTRMREEKLPFPSAIPKTWIVDCQFVGAGDKALIYLGRYLYRWVIREKDILSCQDGKVTYRYQDSKTKRYQTNILLKFDFLWLVLQHRCFA
ncbi:hypothetical protein BMR10_09395 [Methylococcaceae bacterium CS4]|nr:hypothetical protein BMR10_09395 [Methylococcaceae bacterium CS4]